MKIKTFQKVLPSSIQIHLIVYHLLNMYCGIPFTYIKNKMFKSSHSDDMILILIH